MFPFFALIVSLGCIAASVKRLWLAANATALDPGSLVVALRGDAGRTRFTEICAGIASTPEATWERELVAAIERPERERAALVNELLTELDWMAQRWQRVPRVCASVASSTGFLFASLVLRAGLADPSALSGDVTELVTRGLVGDALSVAAIGLATAIFCAATQIRARTMVKERMAATDKLVERLEMLAGSAAPGA